MKLLLTPLHINGFNLIASSYFLSKIDFSMAGVVSGTLNSTVALIGTASSGISYLSGDSEFIKQRLLSRQKIHASRHGAFDSLKDGGEQLLSGSTEDIYA